MQHQIGQAQVAGAVEGPLETFEAFGPGRRVAEAAGLLDAGRGGVILAGEAEHGPGHAETRGPGGLGHFVPFLPGGVMRVSTGDLHHVDAEPAQQLFQLGHAFHLQRPAAQTNGQWFDGHEIEPPLLNGYLTDRLEVRHLR